MTVWTLYAFLGFVYVAGLYRLTKNTAVYWATIFFGLLFYHLALRLSTAVLSDMFYREKFDYRAKWFCRMAFEERLYRKIKVKQWKKRLPTYSPHDFSMQKDSVPRVLRATCQAEAVHEVVMILSFVPVILSVWLGHFWFFAITGLLMFLFDSIFVIAQRYNRPRLVRLLDKSAPLSDG